MTSTHHSLISSNSLEVGMLDALSDAEEGTVELNQVETGDSEVELPEYEALNRAFAATDLPAHYDDTVALSGLLASFPVFSQGGERTKQL